MSVTDALTPVNDLLNIGISVIGKTKANIKETVPRAVKTWLHASFPPRKTYALYVAETETKSAITAASVETLTSIDNLVCDN